LIEAALQLPAAAETSRRLCNSRPFLICETQLRSVTAAAHWCMFRVQSIERCTSFDLRQNATRSSVESVTGEWWRASLGLSLAPSTFSEDFRHGTLLIHM
jgi:hypothetical protein